ncbi:unnamed protein product, partial [Allacma fusca]
EHALNLVKNNLTTDSDNITYEDLYDALLTAEISHDEDLLKPEWEQDPKFFTEPIGQGLDQLGSPTQRTSKKSLQYKESENKKYSLSRFSGICNDRFHQNNSELSKLFCCDSVINKSHSRGLQKISLQCFNPKLLAAPI